MATTSLDMARWCDTSTRTGRLQRASWSAHHVWESLLQDGSDADAWDARRAENARRAHDWFVRVTTALRRSEHLDRVRGRRPW